MDLLERLREEIVNDDWTKLFDQIEKKEEEEELKENKKDDK